MKFKRAGMIALLFILLMTVIGAAFAQTPDSDGDTVPDTRDRCPTQAGSVANGGCPDRPADDRDGDGVADFVDQCPDAAGTGFTNGCPAGGDTPPQATPYVPIPPEWADPEACMVGVPVNAPGDVNVRETASTNATILGTVAPGTQWEPWLRDYDDANQIWFDGAPVQGGWVRGDQVILHGDCVYLPQVIHVDAPQPGVILVDFDPSLIPQLGPDDGAGGLLDPGIIVIDPDHIPTIDPTHVPAPTATPERLRQPQIHLFIGDAEFDLNDRLIIAILPDPAVGDPTGLPFEALVLMPDFGDGEGQCPPDAWNRGMGALDITDGTDTSLIGLLLPAVQKVREAAARLRGGIYVAAGDINGVVGETEAQGGGVGKVSIQDVHFFWVGDPAGDGAESSHHTNVDRFIHFIGDGSVMPGEGSCATWVFLGDGSVMPNGAQGLIGFGLLLPAV